MNEDEIREYTTFMVKMIVQSCLDKSFQLQIAVNILVSLIINYTDGPDKEILEYLKKRIKEGREDYEKKIKEEKDGNI